MLGLLSIDRLGGSCPSLDTAPAYRHVSFRAKPPAETLRRIVPLMAAAGITRLADVTYLDALCVPVFQAIRPNSRNISVSQGKGLTADQAKVSALMETFETFHAEQIPQASRVCSVRQMRKEINYDPLELPLIRRNNRNDRNRRDESSRPTPLLHDESCLPWIECVELPSGKRTWVPREYCELDFTRTLGVSYFEAGSNGLASGNTLVEAMIHGLLEVVERDSLCRGNTRWRDGEFCVNLSTVSSKLFQRLLATIESKAMSLQVFDLTGPIGIPCFEAYLSEKGHRTYRGAGCHFSSVSALIRSALEAIQGRLAHIAGSRDDMTRDTYHFGSIGTIEAARDFRAVRSLRFGTWRQAVLELTQRIRNVSGFDPIAVDLSKPAIKIPVVFVVAPGLKHQASHRVDSASWLADSCSFVGQR